MCNPSTLKKTLCAVLAASMSMAALTGCGGSGNAPASSSPAASAGAAASSSAASTSSASAGAEKASGGPITIEWLAYQTSAQPDTNSTVYKKVEELFGCTFNCWYIDDQQWDQSLNVKLAAGQMPDIMYVKSPVNIPSYVKQGIVDELPRTLIEEKAPTYYKQIMEADKDDIAWDAVTVDGKNYGFMHITLDGLYSPIIGWRQDWLEKAGITKLPSTIEEFEAAMYAFANEDPDGNGKKDTYGMSDKNVRAVFGAFGVPYSQDGLHYILGDDGKPVYSVTQPGAKDALTLLAKWYKDGVIDPEFITGESTGGTATVSDALINGRIGSSSGLFYHFMPPMDGDSKGGRNYADTIALNASAKVVSGPAPVGPGGKSGLANSGPFRTPTVITTQAKKDPRKIDILFAMLERMYADEEYADMVRYGLEGEHFQTQPDGTRKNLIPDIKNNRAVGLQIFNFLNVPSALKIREAPKKYAYADEVAKGPCYNNLQIPATETMSSNAATLARITEEAFAKIITGEKPVEYYDEFLTTFMKNGGEASTADMQKSYAALKGLS